MPYIDPSRRLRMLAYLKTKEEPPNVTGPENAGDLNFLICTIIKNSQENAAALVEAVCIDYLRPDLLCYQRINDVVGALRCATMEAERRGWIKNRHWRRSHANLLTTRLYNRIAASYENEAIVKNGDL